VGVAHLTRGGRSCSWALYRYLLSCDTHRVFNCTPFKRILPDLSEISTHCCCSNGLQLLYQRIAIATNAADAGSQSGVGTRKADTVSTRHNKTCLSCLSNKTSKTEFFTRPCAISSHSKRKKRHGAKMQRAGTGSKTRWCILA